MSNLLSSPAFLAGAAVLCAIAIAFVLLPMLRGGGEAARLRRRRRALEELRDDLPEADYRQRIARLDAEQQAGSEPLSSSIRGLAVLLLAAIPICGLVLYLQIGTPDGIDPETGQTGELREMLGDLTGRVRAQPEDIEAWNQLGMLYKQLQQYPAAESAFRRVVFLDPADSVARVELAETLLYQAGQARLPAESTQLLREVLADDPGNQKALWLAGLGAFHDGDGDRAQALWTRLEQQLPEGPVRQRVREQLAQVDAAPAPATTTDLPPGHPPISSGGPPSGTSNAPPAQASPAQPDPTPAEPPAPASETRVAVDVSISESLIDRVSGSETVFVFARAVGGPPAPLAVKRLPASALPATVLLSESDSMAEGLTLGTFPNVRVTARLSRSGNVIASTGDLEGQTEPFSPTSSDEVAVVIDRIVE